MKTIKNDYGDLKRRLRRLLNVITAISILFFLFNFLNFFSFLNCSYAAVPHLINYQGKLTDSAGKPVSDKAYSVTFRLYDSSGTIKWQGTYSVITNKGIFNVVLGDKNDSTYNFSTLLFDVQYWLGIKVEGDLEMTPRQQITSAGYAFRAENADNLTTVLPVTGGGTGATTAIAARYNLGSGTASLQAFPAPGTSIWVAPAGVTMVFLTMCGGGGGGGGGTGVNLAFQGPVGGGGGAGGEVFINKPIAVTGGSSYTITVGAAGSGGAPRTNGTAGGNATFGTLLTARGGGGGGGAVSTYGLGGSGYGGLGSTTDPGSFAGCVGDHGYGRNVGGTGSGGNTYLGSIGGVQGSPGTAGTGYGAGGGGGCQGDTAGGNGTAGICIVMY